MYEQQILKILISVGQRGIKVKSLVKHVYNENVSFFATPDYEEISSYVRNYLRRKSRSPQSLIEKTSRRGYYRLNPNSSVAVQQLVAAYGGETEETDEKGDSDTAATETGTNMIPGLFD